MFNRFHCILDLMIPNPTETLFPTEETVPQTGEVGTALEGVNIMTILLLLVVLIFVAVGVVYFFMLKKKIASPNAGVTSEENKE